MLRIVMRKIKNKLWLNLCLLLGLMILIGASVCHPILLNGARYRILNQYFEQELLEQRNPAQITKDTTYQVDSSDGILAIDELLAKEQEEWTSNLRLRCMSIQQYQMLGYNSCNVSTSLRQQSQYVCYAKDFENHIEMCYGDNIYEITDFDNWQKSYPQTEEETATYGAYYPCMISQESVDRKGLTIGTRIDYPALEDSNHTRLTLIVVGVCNKTDALDPYWIEDLTAGQDNLYITKEVSAAIVERFSIHAMRSKINVLYDYTTIPPDRAKSIEHYLSNLVDNSDHEITTKLSTSLHSANQDMDSVTMILYTLEIPILVLVLLFLYMVSARIVAAEAGETASIRARGSSRLQVLWMYLLQVLIIALIAGIAGLGFGMLLALIGGSTNAFLSFYENDLSRYQFHSSCLIYALVAATVAIMIVMIPAIPTSKGTIVTAKKKNRRVGQRPWFEIFFVDVILLAVSSYLLYNHRRQMDTMITEILAGKSPDPVCFLNASIFILALALVVIRLIRYIVILIDVIFRKRMNTIFYLSMVQVRRTYSKQALWAIFLIMTIASGIFDANLAGTIHTVNEQRAMYDVGCDARFELTFPYTKMTDDKGNNTTYYKEPDYGKLEQIAKEHDVASMTRVMMAKDVTVESKGNAFSHCQYMAVQTKEFGETATLQEGLNHEHWYNALNALAQTLDGVIISRSLADALSVEVNDKITVTSKMRGSAGQTADVTIVAIVDAWPGYNSYGYEEVTRVEALGGNLDELSEAEKENAALEVGLRQYDQYLVVMNYGQALGTLGLTPYTLWVRYNNLSEREILTHTKTLKEAFANELQTFSSKANVTVAQSSIEQRNDAQSQAILQVMNGIFTLSFLISAVIALVGFLIYWIVSIQDRALQFGVYRAMGVHENQIHQMLLWEQFFCTILPSILAVFVGFATTIGFTKLVSLVCLPKQHTIPITVFIDQQGLLRIGIVLAIALAICVIVLARQTDRLNITSAIKMGED